MEGTNNTYDYTYNDFDSGKVFEDLVKIDDPYKQGMAERRAAARASEVKFRNFAKLFRLYKQQHEKKNLPVIEQGGLTEFGDQDLELSTGDWHADELGIWKYGTGGGYQIIACSHPIMPVLKMRSIDTNTIKYKLAFKRGMAGNFQKTWSFIDIDAQDMSNPTKIVDKLAPYGVSVTGGDRAKALVDYLRDVIDINYDTIPEVQSVSRMGWNEQGFSPYVGGVEFDGSAAFAGTCKAIAETGSYDVWKAEAIRARSYSTTARIVLAASFAAPLVEKLGVLPFFVHLWSAASGTGKTVAQMLGASVWGNPSPGGAFFPTFRSTSVGLEMMAGFLHSIPLFIDELQLAKDSHGQVRFNVYELASGSGKLRSNKSLGLNYIPTWAMCFITSGESPIVSETDGEGALNRVFEIECYANDKVIEDGHKTANVLKLNYGFAGKDFVMHLQEDGAIQHARDLYEQFYLSCAGNDTTEKQAMAAACILTGDALATEWIFQDDNALTVSDIGEFMKSREGISLMERGYNVLCDWVTINSNKLRGIHEDDKGECYGIVDGDTAFIIRSVFSRVCADNGLSEKGLLSHLRSRGLIDCRDGKFVRTKRIGPTQVATCVWLKLPKPDGSAEIANILDDELPF